MSEFKIHDTQSAPEDARSLLQGASERLGFVPNLYGLLAEAPKVLEAYFTLSDLFGETSLTPFEQQVVLLAVSVENECRFCVAAHSTIARHMVKVDSAAVDALRDQRRIDDPRLEALRRFTTAVTRERGAVRGAELDAFLQSGYTRQQVIEVVLGVTMKTLSNYSNHVFDTPVDDAFASEAWAPAAK
jgi:uncharacterized peroxidase-related enzyme